MSDLKVKQSKKSGESNSRVLTVAGAMTIPYASDLKKALLKASKGCEHLYLDLQKVDEVDLTGLQLLCSTHRTSILQSMQLTVIGEFPDSISIAANNAGFVRHVGCEIDVSKSCLWCGGKC